MTRQQLLSASADRRHRKWASVCALRAAGLETLDGLMLSPDAVGQAETAFDDLMRLVGGTKLLIRSDGGVEEQGYYRGGDSFERNEALNGIARLLDAGRAVLLFEATNRFTNRLSANICLTKDGTLLIETLGSGFDVSDLNRGGVAPAATYTIRQIDWGSYTPFCLSAVLVEQRDDEASVTRRLNQRLEILASEVLPRTGAFSAGSGTAGDAEAWLRARGFVGLWERQEVLSDARIRRIYDSAFMIADMFRDETWYCLSASLSMLESGRTIYWDVVDSRAKYALATGTT